MRATDQMLATYIAEIEERQTLIDGIVEAVPSGQDLSEEQLELVTRAQERIAVINKNMAPLEATRRSDLDNRQRLGELARILQDSPQAPKEVEYRSAGEYVLEYWRARSGDDLARQRLDMYQRAASHQTTSDNPGLIPTPILGPIVNFIDAQRPVVNALGVRQLPGGSWSRPVVTQHTQITAQGGEKTELASRKMTITKTPVTPTTYGGYVNVSRQDMDWSQPAIMDIVIGDLAAQYAIATEAAAAVALFTGGTAADASTTIPTGAATAQQIAGAVWAAAGKVYTATQGVGTLVLAVSPDMLGLIGPLFAPINPRTAQSEGFYASEYGQGVLGAVSGISVVVSAGFAAGSMLMISTAAAECYEDRIGALQVIEPSVLGTQVAYAGYFTQIVLLATGLQKIVKTP